MIRPESVSPGHDSHWHVSPLYIIYITVYDVKEMNKILLILALFVDIIYI